MNVLDSSADESSAQMLTQIGDSLLWNSPVREIGLYLELPFWLLMPSSTVSVALSGIETHVVIQNDGVVIQHGHQYSRNHHNTVFMGSHDAAKRATVSPLNVISGGLVRATRTLLILTAHAHQDALDACFGPDGRRYQDASRYFASLCYGHLPIVNELINAYRRASIDPFANEVTAWDVPVWMLVDSPRRHPVYLYSHLVEDWYPTYSTGGDQKERIPKHATSRDAVLAQLSIKDCPGEIEMLDGWSLFHRGRYGDSIRSFVTAVEVLLEAEIKRALIALAYSPHAIEERLTKTRRNFEDRLSDYCELTRKRPPGPLVHFLPWLNGRRLIEEIRFTRQLRHDIVHSGHRMDESFAGGMLRAAETTSWFFDWMSSKGDFEARRKKQAGFFGALRNDGIRFQTEVRDGKILVRPPATLFQDPNTSQVRSPNRVIYDKEKFKALISPASEPTKDLELFVLMAFHEFHEFEIWDSPFEVSPSSLSDRFRFSLRGKAGAIFLLNCVEPLARPHLEDIVARRESTRLSGISVDHTIAVMNASMDVDWRKRGDGITKQLNEFALDNSITIVTTSDLTRLVLAVVDYDWAITPLVDEVLQSGVRWTTPPAAKLLGHVYRYWDKRRVVGIQKVDSQTVSAGQRVAFKLLERFHIEEILDFQLDDEGRLTFKVSIPKNEVALSGEVYLLDQTLSFQQKSNAEMKSEPSIEVGWSSRVVHPSRQE